MTAETKTCQNCKQPFTVELEDFDFYKKISVPLPTRCSDCRLQRRLAFRNERVLYRRKCDLTGESVVSLYAEDAPFPVYSQKAWWGDGWDAFRYGRDYDFSRPFFEQFAELYKTVPRFSLMNRQCVNSDYCPWSINYKNSFLCVSGNTCEECYYGFFLVRSREVFDSAYVEDSELCYECIDSDHLSRSAWCTECRQSTNLWFCEDCVSCTNCFGCVGLRNKEHCLFNEQLTKEEWAAAVETLQKDLLDNEKMVHRRVRELRTGFPARFAYIIKCVACIGDKLLNSKNTRNSFDSYNLEDCAFVANAGVCKDSYDTNFFIKGERCYESLSTPNSYNTLFSTVCWDDRDVYYSDQCFNSNDLFGCIGVRTASHCILNKRYEPEAYAALVPQIIEHMKSTGEWGEFFPPSLSPFGYNETTAMDYFPLTETEAHEKGFHWIDRISGMFGKETIQWTEIPKRIESVGEGITKEIFACPACKKNFKILEPELSFYKRMRIPLPRQCQDCRHSNRLQRRNPRKLWHRACHCVGAKSENGAYTNTGTHAHGAGKCPNEFETSYAPDRPEIVYCEQCYNAEVA